MLFRGVLQGFAARWLGPALGLVIGSVLFGLLHPITWIYALLAAGLGLYLGAVWLVSDNLWAVVIALALYDFLVLVYLLRMQRARSVSDG
jgi:membrane protease YdiL (CAAX protease family)